MEAPIEPLPGQGVSMQSALFVVCKKQKDVIKSASGGGKEEAAYRPK
jgi:hypothetical protein